ncbi:AraC family transcriptional regulator [Lacihabitans soyangensis]|uniref:AraC family transcriptional regulator n=2 Tax=Lacihabitans soyangensis TaxID=869394 RepID=A0AAE3H4G4_9BACT|nr:AraC family transcriptional regulator [Lacihabitans soyangensis]
MRENAINEFVNLRMHMFSFLQTGEKLVTFSERSVAINKNQFIILKSGNFVITEKIDIEENYYCKLIFFSNKMVDFFLSKYSNWIKKSINLEYQPPYYCLESDDYIANFVSSLTAIRGLSGVNEIRLLEIKFEELLVYLIGKCGQEFIDFFYSLVSSSININLRHVVETNLYNNLDLDEMAFLANMSLSTFKRQFKKEYKTNPGRWIKERKLNYAKLLMEREKKHAKEIFADFGYSNLSNFNSAFKNHFGFLPSEIDVQ